MSELSAAPVAASAEPEPAPSRTSEYARRRPWLWLGVAAAGVVLASLLAPSEPLPLPIGLRWLAASVLFVALPGWLLVGLVRPAGAAAEGGGLEVVLLSGAAGYSVAVLLGLVLHTLFRPIAPWQIAAGGGLLVLGLALARSRERPHPPAPPHCGGEGETKNLLPSPPQWGGGWGWGFPVLRWVVGPGWGVLLILAVAAPLRLADLGWSEFQGDEARVVLRAMAALQGADGALAAHRKVPGEILLAYLFAGSLGQIEEQTARLPFALAGVGAVLAFYLLARRLLGGAAAVAAGLLLAVNGYFVAFGRILQYDSLAFFLGVAGLLCCWRFGRVSRGEQLVSSQETSSGTPAAALEAAETSAVRWAFLGALLLSGAALVALGAVFLLPPALLLSGPGLLRYRRCWRVVVAWIWPVVPGALAAVLVFGASGPADGPSGIWSYLGPRLGGDRPYWNGVDFLISANHYLSSPYLLVMLLALGLALLLGLAGVLRTLGGRGVALRLGVAIVLAGLTWNRPLAALALGAVLLLVLILQVPPGHAGSAKGSPLDRLFARFAGAWPGLRVALVWAAGPLFVHLLLIRVPGTHWREAFPGLILVLASLVAPHLAGRCTGLAIGALLGMLSVGAGQYSYVTLVQRLPEYQLVYPANCHLLDWSNRDGRGIGGVFGVVHRHGWKALGVLMAEGTLPGGYVTNESPAIAAWYVRQPQGCEGALAYVFRVPRAPHDRNLAVPVPLPTGYQTRSRVRVYGRATIALQLPPGTSTRAGDIAAEPYEARFDRELASAWRPVGELYRADLGAATAKRACAAQPFVPRFR